MNPLIQGVCKNTNFISKVLGTKVAHLNPYTMAMYFVRYGLYSAEKDRVLPDRYKVHNEKYEFDLKEIQNYQKTFAERTWKLEKVIKVNFTSFNLLRKIIF